MLHYNITLKEYSALPVVSNESIRRKNRYLAPNNHRSTSR